MIDVASWLESLLVRDGSSGLGEGLEIVEVSGGERRELEPIVEASFTGWYRSHAKRTLHSIETVRAAVIDGRSVGLVMLSWLNKEAGYVYYVAVLPEARRQGVASKLLDHSLEGFFQNGATAVYASVTTDHEEPMELFTSRGFKETGFKELSGKYGWLSAMNLYRKMLVVSGEMLLVRER